ncbi:pectinesterase family protein [Sphingobacterium oryzagri]|uniref:Pectinesterase n=1 Tax=Sphingobacterium oryzagri TaxID=3025669 RepID=A0ABY7WKJ1_9SPHI|nr:pectinesterase family protein [Sphingobacterium sp. KACC 22765]WDF68815.1 pectinesterase family protein [Sphingobacterium sp. KACC 22765]
MSLYLSKIVFFALLCLCAGHSKAQTIDNRLELVVSQAGDADFTSIQEAINQVRDHAEKRVTIHIKAGTYKEKLVIPAYKRNISLKGEDRENTIISFDDYSGKPFRGIDASGNQKHNTYTTYVLLLSANDCSLENLTIVNTAGSVGQAVALHIDGDRISIRNCTILGYQDTLYLARGGTRSFFENCLITGTTDFIFGAATAYFLHCDIESLSNSYITAASTTAADAYGFVFESCSLRAKENTVTKVYLGRPWRPFAKTVFLNCDMGSHILPEGWHAWPGDKNFPNKEQTVFYAEHGSKGAGGTDLSKRVSWSRQLRKKALRKHSLSAVLGNWKPF